jgi:hypothetical protein
LRAIAADLIRLPVRSSVPSISARSSTTAPEVANPPSSTNSRAILTPLANNAGPLATSIRVPRSRISLPSRALGKRTSPRMVARPMNQPPRMVAPSARIARSPPPVMSHSVKPICPSIWAPAKRRLPPIFAPRIVQLPPTCMTSASIARPLLSMTMSLAASPCSIRAPAS